MSGKHKKKIIQVQQKPVQVKLSYKNETSAVILKWAPLAILLFTCLLYLKAVNNDFVGWDDDLYIVKNPFIKNFGFNGIIDIFTSFQSSGNYHPLTTLTNLFIYNWFGLDPMPYHLLNVLLHLLNTWLVYKFTEQLSGKKISAIIVSLLFAVHPMHVESVAWISELKDVLYTSFYLLSLMIYLNYLKYDRHVKLYIGALLFFVCSLLSKSAAVTLPVLLIAIDIYKGRKINTKLILEKVPFLLLSLLFGILAILSQQAKGAINEIAFSYNFVERIFIFTYTIAFYLIKLVAPFNLSAMHYYPAIIKGSALPWLYYASLPFLLLMIWPVVRRNSFRKEILFGVFFFIIVISVMLQIIHVGLTLTAERYTYVSYIGLFFIAGQWISDKVKKQTVTVYSKGRNIVIILFSLIVILFSYQTWVRIGIWKDYNTLFTDVIKKNPNYYHGYLVRGVFKLNNGDYQGALQDFNKTLKYNPTHVACLISRGNVLNELNDYKGALQDENLAISLDSAFAEAYNYRGKAYYGLNNIKLSILDYDKAIQLKPDYAEAYNNRGSAYDAIENAKSALLDFDKAVTLNPKLYMAYNNRGVVKAKSGDLAGALEDINKAIEINPEEPKAYSDRGHVKAIQKDYKGSIKDFDIALKLKPDGMDYNNRGFSHLYLKDTVGACEDWKNAIKYGYNDALQMINKYCH